MNIYLNRSNWQAFLFLFAILIGVGSLIYTQFLVRSLKAEERKKVEMWAEATRLINSADSTQNLDFLLTIIQNNNTVPVILTDGHDNIINTRNLGQLKTQDPGFMAEKIEKMKSDNQPIIIDLGNGFTNRIYYKDSIILSQLIYYPFHSAWVHNTVYSGFLSCIKLITQSRTEQGLGRHVKRDSPSAWNTNHIIIRMG